ncbi:MAG: hypothetical protein KJ867_03330 [Gammaproteobacteria bacterium]|nr:hypothetical protein [Gammaproteobacteria bacterium]
MQEIKDILQIFVSWPFATVIAVLAMRRPLHKLVDRLVNSETGKAKIGPVEVELGKLAEQGQQAVIQLNKINYIMAESRLLELEITEGNFGPVFSEEQRNKMKQHIDELRKLTTQVHG